MTDRRALRQSLRAARAAAVAALSPAAHAAAEAALAAHVLGALPSSPAVIASYAAIGDEIDPALLDAALAARGWTLAFPRVVGMAPLTFHACPRAALRPGFKGIPEPPADAPPVRPDWLLVPLLGVDGLGNRIGQGAGHYDRSLADLRGAGRATAIGLAWEASRVAAIDVQPWDQPLDAVATPARFRWLR